jgi:hypothetical protein
MAPVDFSDAAGSRELAQAIDGEGQVRVAPHPGMVEGLAAMGVPERRDAHVGRNLAEARVSSALRLVERFLARSHETGARDERHAALRKGSGKRSPRHRIDAPPPVRPEEEAYLERKLRQLAHRQKITSLRMPGVMHPPRAAGPESG